MTNLLEANPQDDPGTRGDEFFVVNGDSYGARRAAAPVRARAVQRLDLVHVRRRGANGKARCATSPATIAGTI